MATLLTCIVAFVLVASAAGCGMIKLGYRNGDRVGLFFADRYLDLSGEQEEFVKPRLHQLLVWHRTTQLPDYIAFAEGLQKRAPQSISGAEVAALDEQAKRRAMVFVDRCIPDLADLALRLTPENVRALRTRYDEDDAKWKKENLRGDVDGQRKVRYEKALERTEEWYGRFDREQREAIRRLSDARPFDNDLILAERQRREEGLTRVLDRVVREKPSREAVIAALRTYAAEFEHGPDARASALLDSYHRASDDMTAGIHNLATPQQRQRAVARLQEWIDDFRSLANDPG